MFAKKVIQKHKWKDNCSFLYDSGKTSKRCAIWAGSRRWVGVLPREVGEDLSRKWVGTVWVRCRVFTGLESSEWWEVWCNWIKSCVEWRGRKWSQRSKLALEYPGELWFVGNVKSLKVLNRKISFYGKIIFAVLSRVHCTEKVTSVCVCV